ncbi:hypothetical protein ACIP88_04930 [Streptomyces uncialis]|uniref:hypothetical protein n=1 Tax=Streptomyces uncialis TaxID=1048205 RepID=UPI00381070D1
MEIVETNHEPGTGVLAMSVRVNGTDVGRLAKAPKVAAGDGRERMATVTLVLVPSVVEIKGDGVKDTRTSIGFTAE